jgi:hypothetical protein
MEQNHARTYETTNKWDISPIDARKVGGGLHNGQHTVIDCDISQWDPIGTHHGTGPALAAILIGIFAIAASF